MVIILGVDVLFKNITSERIIPRYIANSNSRNKVEKNVTAKIEVSVLLTFKICLIFSKSIKLYQTRIITQAIADIEIYLVTGAINKIIIIKNIAANIAEAGVFAPAE
jgi:hypothetical protein